MLDDHGQTVRVLRSAGFHDWPVAGDPRMENLVRRVGLAMQGSRRGTRILASLASMVLFGGAVVAIYLGFRWFVPGLPGWVRIVALLLVTGLGGAVFSRLTARMNERAIADLIVEEGLCPCCGYNFHGLAEGADGCIVCPECSAAWLRSRVARTADFAPGAKLISAGALLKAGASSAGEAWATQDDRGRRVMLVTPRLRSAIAATPRISARAGKLRLVRTAIARASRGPRAVGLAVVWLLAAGCIGFMSYLGWRDGPRVYFLVAISWLVMGGLAAWATLGNFCYRATATRRILLEHGLCPTCAGELEPALTEPDGCRVCPTCRSAWRL